MRRIIKHIGRAHKIVASWVSKGKNTEEKRIRTAGEFFDYIGETKNIEAIELFEKMASP